MTSCSENCEDVEKNEDYDLYSDVLTDQDTTISKLNEKVEKLTLEKNILIKQLEKSQKELELLKKNDEELSQKYKTISYNASALLKTAKSEIARKNRTIKELRLQYDNLVFRKIPRDEKTRCRMRRSSSVSSKTRTSSVRRSVDRRSTQISRRRHSTPKKQETSLCKSETININNKNENDVKDKSPVIKKESNIEEASQSLIKTSETLNISLSDSKPLNPAGEKSVNSLVKDNINVNNYNIVESKLVDGHTTNNTLSKENVARSNNNISEKPKITVYQPLQGPLTPYSIRMYKKLHGVSPPKLTPAVSDHAGNSRIKGNGKLFDTHRLSLVNQTLEPPCEQQVLKTNTQEEMEEEISEVKDYKTESTQIENNSKIEVKNNTSPPTMQQLISELTKTQQNNLHGGSPNIYQSLKSTITNYETTEQDNVNSPKAAVKDVVNVKPSTITLKLQEDVKQLIKLGTNIHNKTSPPTVKKEKQTYSPQIEISNSRPSEKLIIQCDLNQQNTPIKTCKTSPNIVSMNETFQNIIKNQKAGIYNSATKTRLENGLPPNDANIHSPNKSVGNNGHISEKNCSVKKQNGSNSPNTIFANLTKKPPKKTVIAPVTFGNRISAGQVCNKGDNPKPFSTSFNKMLSEDISKHPDTSPLQTKIQNSKITEKTASGKSKVITSLFGESPLKSVQQNNIIPEPEKDIIKINDRVSPIPLCNSPILPDSPSLDSDNTEDLIIDTTACSKNTSPRVSECEHKDELETSPGINLQTSSISVTHQGNVTETLIGTNFQVNSNIIKNTTKQENHVTMCKDNVIDNDSKKCLNDPAPPLFYTTTDTIQMSSDPVSAENKSINKENQSDNDEKKLNLCISATSNLDKPISPEISIESDQSVLEENKEVIDINKGIKNQAPTRFIPSPPQLTLVSAFRHSENSVFTLAEDTLGFVSALTRVRDISPIRTPDKKCKEISEVLKTPESEDFEPKIDCFVIRTNINHTTSIFSNNSDAPEISNLHEDNKVSNNTLEIQSNQKPNYIEELLVDSNTSNKKEIKVVEKKASCVDVETNTFRRSRPVRRLTTSQAPILCNKENINDVENLSVTQSKCKVNNSNENQSETSKNNIEPSTELKSELCKVYNITTNNACEGYSDKDTKPDRNNKYSKPLGIAMRDDFNTKTFKRSESLKMLSKKPSLKDVCTINKTTNDVKTDTSSCKIKVVETNFNSLTQPKVEIKIDKLSKNVLPPAKDINKGELEQIPHIASINQRVRVSNYQGGKNKPVNILPIEENVVSNLAKSVKKNKQDITKISLDKVQSPPKIDKVKNKVIDNNTIPKCEATPNINLRSLQNKSPKLTKNLSSKCTTKEPLQQPILDEKIKDSNPAISVSLNSKSNNKLNPKAMTIESEHSPPKSRNEKVGETFKLGFAKQQPQSSSPNNDKNLTNQNLRPSGESFSDRATTTNESPMNKTSDDNHQKDHSVSTISKSRSKSTMLKICDSAKKSPNHEQITSNINTKKSKSSCLDDCHTIKQLGSSPSKEIVNVSLSPVQNKTTEKKFQREVSHTSDSTNKDSCRKSPEKCQMKSNKYPKRRSESRSPDSRHKSYDRHRSRRQRSPYMRSHHRSCLDDCHTIKQLGSSPSKEIVNVSLSPVQNKTTEKKFQREVSHTSDSTNKDSCRKSPEKCQMKSNKYPKRRSESRSPDSRHKSYDRHRSRRQRSPYMRSHHRSRRSRSISPYLVKQNRFSSRYEYYHNRHVSRNHNHRKRSRSRSNEHLRSKSSGSNNKRNNENFNEHHLKRSSGITSNKKEEQDKTTVSKQDPPLNYAEELERLRQELSLVKSKLMNEKTSDSVVETPLTTQHAPTKRPLECSPSESGAAKRIKVTLDSEESNHVTQDSSINNHTNVDSGDNSCVKELNKTPTSTNNMATTIPTKPVNVIKLKRRTRNLGDSEVKVVSFDSPGTSVTKGNLTI